MTTLRYVIEVETTDPRPEVVARLAAELDDAIRHRFDTVTIHPVRRPTYPPGSCEEAP